MNLLLAVSKIIVGSLFSAHAVLLDGVNSLGDLVSSAMSILCTVAGARKANASHPFGYGRLEYISSMVVTMFILYVGIRSMVGSVRTIFVPDEPPSYNSLVLILMIISLAGKAAYGIVMRRKGRQIHSIVMIMTGTESLGDALVSVAIIAAIVVYKLTGVDIEHYLCIAISLLIIYTGVRMIIESLTKILGTRPDPEIKKRITHLFIEEEAVLNVSNLILHNYGENIYVGSADIEVDENMRAGDISALSRKLIEKAGGCGVTITSIGISGTNLQDPEADRIRDFIMDSALQYPGIRRIHSLNIDFEAKALSFYVVQDYAGNAQEQERRDLQTQIREAFPEMQVEIYTSLNA